MKVNILSPLGLMTNDHSFQIANDGEVKNRLVSKNHRARKQTQGLDHRIFRKRVNDKGTDEEIE
jgi:hypothetical protein